MSSPTNENAYPTNRLLQIRFGEARVVAIESNAAALGVPEMEASRYTSDVAAAQAANDQYEADRRRTLASGKIARDTATKMNRTAASVIANVRAKAEVSADPAAVYTLASIAPRATPTPQGPPAQPTGVTCSLEVDGRTRVTWTGSTEKTAFSVERQLSMADGTQTPYLALGGASTRPVFDATVPPGTLVARYRVQALRSRLTSPWSESGSLTMVPNAGAGTAGDLKIAA